MKLNKGSSLKIFFSLVAFGNKFNNKYKGYMLYFGQYNKHDSVFCGCKTYNTLEILK